MQRYYRNIVLIRVPDSYVQDLVNVVAQLPKPEARVKAELYVDEQRKKSQAPITAAEYEQLVYDFSRLFST